MEAYSIIPPAIKSGRVFLFKTDSGLNYEVRFGRKEDNILKASIVFGVTNEEYEGEEYVITNKGEAYRVMATLVKIVKMFMEEHPNIISYEFVGLEKEGEKNNTELTSRLKLYSKYIQQVMDSSWKIEYNHDKVIINKFGA